MQRWWWCTRWWAHWPAGGRAKNPVKNGWENRWWGCKECRCACGGDRNRLWRMHVLLHCCSESHNKNHVDRINGYRSVDEFVGPHRFQLQVKHRVAAASIVLIDSGNDTTWHHETVGNRPVRYLTPTRKMSVGRSTSRFQYLNSWSALSYSTNSPLTYTSAALSEQTAIVKKNQ